VKRLLLPAVLFLLACLSLPVLAQDDSARLDVIDVSGPLDDQALTFIRDTILWAAEAGSEAVILQLDSPGVVGDPGLYGEVLALVADPPLPLAVWIGPAPAVAYGGVVDLLAAAPLRIAAPGAEIGLAEPTIVADRDDDTTRFSPILAENFLVVETTVEDLVDVLQPAIRQIVQELDGVSFPVRGRIVEVSTLTTTEVDGEQVVTTVPVTFHKPGYWARFLRLAVTPEAAFLFLVAGLTVAAFEFYAIGPGVAAAVAAISLFLASYGIATLPVRWWALGLAALGWAALTASYQQGSVATLTVIGTVLVAVGGLWYVDGAPQLEMNPIVTLLIVAAVVLFYVVAMPTVARARFSTRTIGREHLIGRVGVALVDFSPDGEVEVEGARWKASAHREAGIRKGTEVRVTEVDGLVLEVEPVATES
jgi:membrane-bound serine protease (ClpP class)